MRTRPCFCLTNYRLLGDMVMHFPTSQEEITLSTSSQRVSLRNYCEDGKSELNKTIRNCDSDILPLMSRVKFCHRTHEVDAHWDVVTPRRVWPLWARSGLRHNFLSQGAEGNRCIFRGLFYFDTVSVCLCGLLVHVTEHYHISGPAGSWSHMPSWCQIRANLGPFTKILNFSLLHYQISVQVPFVCFVTRLSVWKFGQLVVPAQLIRHDLHQRLRSLMSWMVSQAPCWEAAR